MRRNKAFAALAALSAALVFSVLLSLLVGAVPLTLPEILKGLANPASASGQIVLSVRLPRLAAALLAGMALSASGLVTQTILANPLASAGMLGINAGAGLFAAAAMVIFGAGAMFLLPGAAFLGAAATALLVFGIAKRSGASRLTLVLSGVAVSSLMTAGISALTTCFPSIILGVRDFQIGGLAGATLGGLAPAGVLILVGLLLVLLFAGNLEILSLGEETARALGLRAVFWRFFFLLLASLLSGAAVSFSGLIGFVGLIVPHCTRLLLPGANTRTHIAGALLLGGSFLALCDTAARTLFAPFELPVGILIAFLGAPFFLWLILRERRRSHA
ncbi:MAG: iron ABC transporter permease [Oscillospiraceae bacterium]|jgi:iron complex transport system permease protein|nr:iron ABC transporter permease [Oscillospiraceae bacterium]